MARLPSELLENLFFIRYWHGGPHLRLRLRQPAHAGQLLSSLQGYWRQHGQVVHLDPEQYYSPYRKHFSGEQGDIIYPSGSIEAIEYQPETARYGGDQAIGLCEQFFCSDSRLVLQQLSESDVENERLMFMVSLAYASVAKELGLDGMALLNIEGITANQETVLVSERVRQKFMQNSKAYRLCHENFEVIRQQSGSLLSLDRELSRLILELQQAGVTHIESILHSLLHMSFNRFGVPPFKESTIRYFAYLTLSQLGEHNERQAG